MFIIFGSPRSGTTLLKETLNLHSDIFIPMQTTIISTLAHIIGSTSSWEKACKVAADAIIASDDYPAIFALHLTEAEIRSSLENAPPSLAGVLDALYDALAHKLGKRLCGDKSPDDLLTIRKLEQVGLLDSQIKFIHIIRDVRGSVASLLNVSWAPPGIEEYFPRIWNYTNLHLYKALYNKPNYRLVRYEDLVRTPLTTLTQISDTLGVPFQDAMLDASTRGPELRSDPSHRNLAQPFLPDRIDAWRNQLSNEVSAHCEYSAREAMQIFGYK
ncbi:sulfotransferase [Paraburkholderia acidicola]|uniref:Sulfotransferase n=1 Tax=Paraburkholderia acidicola TaxID=1912599 RepID=A0A2A4EYS1_9BURK|nr:sulfotransferase [Paraburkholderia acidicola]PCE25229.1 sulfotransferase [Paraburkholderia acidicola]